MPLLIVINYEEFEGLADLNLDDIKKISIDGDFETHTMMKKFKLASHAILAMGTITENSERSVQSSIEGEWSNNSLVGINSPALLMPFTQYKVLSLNCQLVVVPKSYEGMVLRKEQQKSLVVTKHKS